MHKYTLYILTFLTGLLFISCEPETTVPDQNKIFTSYTVIYNHSLDKTTATVDFTLDNPSNLSIDKIKLTHPASIKYNAKELLFNENKRNYNKEFIGTVNSQFDYIDYNGTRFINEAVIPEPIVINGLPDTIGITEDLFIIWEGSELQANEQILVTFENIDQNTNFKFNAQASTNNIIPIDQGALYNLGTGNCIVTLARHIIKSVNEKPVAGGSIFTKYEVQDTIYFY
ncbi:MAG: hypothetical protein R2780_07290 [Crocinitomicaceae bacterium]|nr:hypothetical protein [Crocinitomicaceae bacterium]